MSASEFFNTRMVAPLLKLLKQGITPRKLALTIALGFALGIFPMIGSTTVLCALFAWVLRLNQPAIQLINYFTYPLQLAFLIPFFKLGAWIFAADPLPFSVDEVIVMLSSDTWQAIQTLWIANLRAIAAWLLMSPVMVAVLYHTLARVFIRLAAGRIRE